jgi:hypothetical protein
MFRATLRAATLSGMTILLALAPGVASAQADEGAQFEPPVQVVLSGDLIVPRGRVVGEVVVFHGDVLVTGVVRGDVVALDGSVIVSGQVSGAVVSLSGPIRLQRTAQVGQDVYGGEKVVVQSGAQIGGSTKQDVRFTLAGPMAALGVLLASLSMAISALLLGLLLLFLTPRGSERVAAASRTAPLASIGWGLLLAVLVPVLAIAAAATVLGLPLGLATVLALGFLFLLGYTWALWCLGRAIVAAPRNRYLAFGAGWAIGAVIGLVPLLNLVAWGLGSVFGIGAMSVAAWRARGVGRHRVGGVPPADELAPPSAAA